MSAEGQYIIGVVEQGTAMPFAYRKLIALK
jgi:hypothetical protein